MLNSGHYPKPGPIGGRLIREVIAFLRSQSIELPLTSHILIATSGGIDSVGLAHLITHFGRRIVPRSKMTLLHVNHGWRGKESDADEDFVKELGSQWNIPVLCRRLSSPAPESKRSWEEMARDARKQIFAHESKRLDAPVFTAHQSDDLAETVLWRLFTGAAQTHGGGIVFHHGVEYRPLLKIRKKEIKAYLEEVGQSYREDSTNSSSRFLRARMRAALMPEVEKIFPRAIGHLVKLALNAQNQSSNEFSILPPETLFRALGLKARRPHLDMIIEKMVAKKSQCGEIQLPGGWRLVREPPRPKRKKLREIKGSHANQE